VDAGASPGRGLLAAVRKTDFHIGLEFFTATGRWRCTDIGTRVIVAISLEAHEIGSSEYKEGQRVITYRMTDDPIGFNGPPYAVVEHVFDEYDMEGCCLHPLDEDFGDENFGPEPAP
jgi:hypothetical protein